MDWECGFVCWSLTLGCHVGFVGPPSSDRSLWRCGIVVLINKLRMGHLGRSPLPVGQFSHFPDTGQFYGKIIISIVLTEVDGDLEKGWIR